VDPTAPVVEGRLGQTDPGRFVTYAETDGRIPWVLGGQGLDMITPELRVPASAVGDEVCAFVSLTGTGVDTFRFVAGGRRVGDEVAYGPFFWPLRNFPVTGQAVSIEGEVAGVAFTSRFAAELTLEDYVAWTCREVEVEDDGACTWNVYRGEAELLRVGGTDACPATSAAFLPPSPPTLCTDTPGIIDTFDVRDFENPNGPAGCVAGVSDEGRLYPAVLRVRREGDCAPFRLEVDGPACSC
jgi:hypothetical protein